VDKYDAIKHGHTANPGAQRTKGGAGREKKEKKKQCVRRIHVISNILQDEMFEPPNACGRADKKIKVRRVHRQILTRRVKRRSKKHARAGVSFHP
jgi:hypothetical protein